MKQYLRRFAHVAAFAVIATLWAGCSKDPHKVIVGDLRTFSSREADVVAKLSPEDVQTLAEFARAYELIDKSSYSSLIQGTTATWTAVRTFSVQEVLAVARKHQAALVAERIRFAAEIAAENNRRLKAEKAAESAIPRIVKTFVAEENLYCRPKPAEQEQEQTYAEWKKLATYEISLSQIGDMNIAEAREGKSCEQIRAERTVVTFRELQEVCEDFPNTLTRYATEHKGYKALIDGKLSMHMTDASNEEIQVRSSAFFTKFKSTPWTLVKRIPVDSRIVDDTIEFSLVGENGMGHKELALQCRGKRYSEKALVAISQENEAEAKRPKSPTELLISAIAARGGNCSFVAEHLTAHAKRAEQTGDWSSFRSELGRGASYGC